MKIDMAYLTRQYLTIKDELDEAVLKVMHDADYINGGDVQFFADELASYLGVKHVIPTANGTDAIQIALMALNLKPGDEVITSDFSFIAAAEAVAILGLQPVFVDVEYDTFNIDASKIEEKIGPKTKAIIPVHLFGQGADMEAIMAIAKEHNLYVIEDCAQALGSSFSDVSTSYKYGTVGDIGCTSFFPTKNLACFGDGGACFTNNDELAVKLKALTRHGSFERYNHTYLGLNSRLDTMQAAILRKKLNYLDKNLGRRQQVAEKYKTLLTHINKIILPATKYGNTHTFNQFTLKVDEEKRDLLKDFLSKRSIFAQVYYPIPLHSQKVFNNLNLKQSDFSVSEKLCRECLSIPLSSAIYDDEINFVAETISDFFMIYQ